ncbi:MAG: isocitrate/isopropylmalate family dehydrogenase, partial [Myxococcales bacterium]
MKIALLPGDGIGPEIVREARAVLDVVGDKFGHSFSYTTHLIGVIAIDETGEPPPQATLDGCRDADAVLLGAVGGPKWDDPKAKVRPEQGLLAIRKGLGLYANLRPVRVLPELAAASPLKEERLRGVDILFVRELTGGLYFGQPRFREVVDGRRRAVDTLEYTEEEIRRVVRLAFRLAGTRRGLVT